MTCKSNRGKLTILAGIALFFLGGAAHLLSPFTKNSEAFSPPKKVKAVDTTGAGEGFIGSFLWKLCEKKIATENISDVSETDLKERLGFLNKFCAISVTKDGAIDSYPSIDEIN